MRIFCFKNFAQEKLYHFISFRHRFCVCEPEGGKSILAHLFGSLWTHVEDTLGSLWDHFRITLDSLQVHFRVTLESIWNLCRFTLGSLWDHFRITLGSLWAHFGFTLGSLWDHFGVTLGSLWHQASTQGVIYDGLTDPPDTPPCKSRERSQQLPTFRIIAC